MHLPTTEVQSGFKLNYSTTCGIKKSKPNCPAFISFRKVKVPFYSIVKNLLARIVYQIYLHSWLVVGFYTYKHINGSNAINNIIEPKQTRTRTEADAVKGEKKNQSMSPLSTYLHFLGKRTIKLRPERAKTIEGAEKSEAH